MSTPALAVALLCVSAGAFAIGWVAGVYSLHKAAQDGRYDINREDDR
jgi:hypothetical protein